MSDGNNYEDFLPSATETEFSALNGYVAELNDTEAEIAELKAKLKRLEGKAKHISETAMPGEMERLGIAEFKTEDGLTVKVDQKVKVSIPSTDPERAARCFAFLETTGHGGIIKRRVEVSFPKEREEEATQLEVELGGRFEDVGCFKKVESATLGAWARREIAAGRPVPKELFGTNIFKVCKIERPKS